MARRSTAHRFALITHPSKLFAVIWRPEIINLNKAMRPEMTIVTTTRCRHIHADAPGSVLHIASNSSRIKMMTRPYVNEKSGARNAIEPSPNIATKSRSALPGNEPNMTCSLSIRNTLNFQFNVIGIEEASPVAPNIAYYLLTVSLALRQWRAKYLTSPTV